MGTSVFERSYEKLDRSFDLLKTSSAILLEDRKLLVFPIISSIAAIVVMASFALPLGGMRALEALDNGGSALTPPQFMAGFLFYLCEYFVIFFFNTALIGAVMKQFDGESPTLGDGLRIAISRIRSIFGYALIAATVGMILRALQSRLDFVGRIIVSLFGVSWTLATFLVVPVLAARDLGPIEAIAESAELLKRTWGENVFGRTSLGFAFLVIYLGEFLCGALLVAVVSAIHSTFLTIVVETVVIGAFVLTALIYTTLAEIYAAALYRYANYPGHTSGFDSHALAGAFHPAE
jgi:hypothetical protein